MIILLSTDKLSKKEKYSAFNSSVPAPFGSILLGGNISN